MEANGLDPLDESATEDPREHQKWSTLREQFLSRYPTVHVRVYSEKDAVLIKRIQNLMDCGFSLEAACERLVASIPEQGELEPQTLAETLESCCKGFPVKERLRSKLCADCMWRPRQQ